jgi:hypothetical protein
MFKNALPVILERKGDPSLEHCELLSNL